MNSKEILNDLAAASRWTAKLNMHEGIANHFSVFVPESDGDFYVNGTGMHFNNIKDIKLKKLGCSCKKL